MIKFHFLGEEFEYKHKRNAIKKIMDLKNCREAEAEEYLENPYYNTNDMSFFFNNKLKELEDEELQIQAREAQLDKYEPIIKQIQLKQQELENRKRACEERETKIKRFMNEPNVEINIEKQEEQEIEEPEIEEQEIEEPKHKIEQQLLSATSSEEEQENIVFADEEPDSIVYVVGLNENEIEVKDNNEDAGYVYASNDIGEEIETGDIVGEWEHIHIYPKDRWDSNCDEEGFLINKDIESPSKFQKRVKLIRIHPFLYKNFGENVYFRDNPYWCEFNTSNKEMVDGENFNENYEGFLFRSRVCERVC